MKLKPYILLFSMFFLYSAHLVAQYYNQRQEFLNANANWTFGDNFGLSFTNGGPTIFQSGISTFEGCASVSSTTTGELLFYAAGEGGVWNRNHQHMPNGSTLLGNTQGSTTQGVVIVPFIDSPGKYYVFTLDPIGTDQQLFYSIVDMDEDGGLGDVDPNRMDILLDADSLSEAMIAIPGNNCDVWLLVHTARDPIFKAYHITRNGVNPNPVISTTGQQKQGRGPLYTATITIWLFGTPLQFTIEVQTGAYLMGGMAVSPDRSMLTIASYVPACMVGVGTPWNGLLLAKFDPATGQVSDAIEVENDLQSYHSIFSPDNSKLYTCEYNVITGNNDLLQFDVTSYDSLAIASSRQFIASMPSVSEGNYFKLYNDTIYITEEYIPYLHRINQPNLSGTTCQYEDSAIDLMHNSDLIMALPADVVFPLPPDTAFAKVLDTLICDDQGGITVYAPPGYTSYLWNDGATDSTRILTTTGVYTVLGMDFCDYRMDSFVVQVEKRDTLQERTDTVICADGEPLFFSVPAGFEYYIWDDNSTDTIRTISDTGTYYLISETFCRSRTDSFFVAPSEIEVTNLTSDTTLCSNEEYMVLTAPAGFSSYRWDDGSADTLRIVTEPGEYYLISTISCRRQTDSFLIRPVDITFDLGADTTICDGSLIVLQIPFDDATAVWQDGSLNPGYEVTGSGTYSVTVSRERCVAADTILLTYIYLHPDLGEDVFVCKDAPVWVALKPDIPANTGVRWSNGSAGPTLIAQETGMYTITLIQAPCSATDTVHIEYELCDCIVEMPGAFSPNGDGKNDIFRPIVEPGCPVRIYQLYIFNRWGQRIYAHTGSDPSVGWDGTYMGNATDMGTYMYQMEIELGTQHHIYQKQGDLMLIR